jgi:ubiquinol-cytochrome c reductase cytochrome b subunit
MAMGMAIMFLFVLPWLDRCKVRSIRYRGWQFKANLTMFVVSFMALGYLGTQAPTAGLTMLAQFFTFTYFSYFVLMWLTSPMEKTKPLPERVTE